MASIISYTKDDLVFLCNCDNDKWYVRRNGSIECIECSNVPKTIVVLEEIYARPNYEKSQ